MLKLASVVRPYRCLTPWVALLCSVGISTVGLASNTVPTEASLEKLALTMHNQFRLQHSAPKLVWDETLAQYAQHHANKCVFKHSSSPYGENLAAGFPSISAAVKTWYAEQQYYSYQHPGFSMRTGHFTQVVWKSSQKLGCAVAACDGKNGTPGNFWVCEYSPHGNMVNRGQFQANVLPARA